MALYLDLNLTDHITVDQKLVGRIPYGLATYYQAVPLAREENRVSVIMAYPDNKTALAVFRGLLQAEIVPIYSSGEVVSALLRRFYSPETMLNSRILAWSATPKLTGTVSQLAKTFSGLLGQSLAMLPANSLDLDAVLTTARQGQYHLTILNPPLAQTPYLLKTSATSLLLVRGNHTRLQQILIVWRGFSSDNRLLDWMLPIVSSNPDDLSVMPLSEPPNRNLVDMLQGDGLAKRHIQGCLQRLEVKGIPVRLKFRQGQPVQQVVDELACSNYDLLVIAAEGYGDFVTTVLTAIEKRGVHAERPIFILKPPFIN